MKLINKKNSQISNGKHNTNQMVLELDMAINNKGESTEILATEDKRYNFLFHNSADPITVIDKKGIFLEINKRFEKESGYKRIEIVGNSLADCNILTKESAEKIILFLKKITVDDSIPIFEVDFIRKDGMIIPCEVGAVLIKKGDTVVGVQANLRNLENRNQVQPALSEPEEHFRTLFQLSPSGIMLENSEGIILEVNPAFCISLGYNREELVGQNVRIVVHPEYAENIDNNFKKLLSGEVLRHVVKSLRKDGSSCHMELSEKKITLPDGKDGILSVSEDISEYQRSEEERIKKSQLQENLLRIVRHLTLSLDIKEVLNEIGNGMMGILNTKSCAIYLLEKDLQTLRPVIAIDPDYKEEVLNTPLNINESFTGKAVKSKCGLIFNDTGPESIGHQIPGTPEELEECIMVAPFIIGEKVIGAICLSRIGVNFTDEELSQTETVATYASAVLKNAQLYNNLKRQVEERKQAQNNVSDLNFRYENFIHNSLVGIWKLELPKPIPVQLPEKEMSSLIKEKGKITDCNNALAQMYGFSSNTEIVGKLLRESIKVFDVSPDQLGKFIANGFKTEMLETQYKDNTGDQHNFRNSYFGVIKGEELHAIWGIQMDITNQRKLEEQLRQSQKLEAIGTLAGGIAHDFNNLLTVINGHAEMSTMNLDVDHPSHKDIKAILIAGKRAKNLTSQLLAFSRKQIYEPRIIEINRAISSSDKMLRRLIGEDINIETNLRPNIPLIKADPGQIEQILINLIVNSRDAINEKTDKAAEKKIIVETNHMYLDESFVTKHTGSTMGSHVVLTVSDTGIGMDTETLEKIFEPFFTTKQKGLGTGLGMSTVYGIVKQNKGSIYAFSEPDLGTKIKIYWPASIESRASEETQILPKAALIGKESILVVEDDEGVRNFVSTALKDLGYTINEAINGKKALELIKDKKLVFDLMITDLIMPEMNGKELAEEVSKILPETLILFSSGYTEDHIVKSGSLEQGINFLQKPYTLQALALKVREVLESK
jgi:PAS domain S-box-containing protein